MISTEIFIDRYNLEIVRPEVGEGSIQVYLCYQPASF